VHHGLLLATCTVFRMKVAFIGSFLWFKPSVVIVGGKISKE